MTKIILSGCLLLCSLWVNSQTKYSTDQVITFDLLNTGGPFPHNFWIKKDVRIRYKISNVNRHVYTVAVNSESKSLFTEKPPVFGIITDIDLSKLAPPLPAEAAGLAGTPLGSLESLSTIAEVQLINNYRSAKTNVNSTITAYNNGDLKFKKLTAHYRALSATLQDGITPFQTLFAGKQASTSLLLSSDFAYGGSATDEAALLTHLQSSTAAILDLQVQQFDRLALRHNLLKQNFVLLEQLFAIKKDELTKRLNAAAAGAKPAVQLIIDNIKIELAVEKLILDGINEVVNDIKLVHAKVVEHVQSGFSQSISNAYQKITLGNWQYISPSILGEKDEVTVKVSIEAKEGTAPSANYGMFNGEVKGTVYGFKIDFSSGFFLLIGEKLIDKSYRVDTIAGDLQNNIIVENDSRQSVQPAVGALMHFYMKRPGAFSWGGNLGFSVSSQTKLNYHGGFTFLFGKEQRIVGSIGAALSHVKEIASSYTVGQKVTRSSGLNTVPTENFYRLGVFVAITFNLSN